MGQKLSLRRMASLSDDDDDLVSIASGTRSLPNRRKTSRANKKSPISLFPLASAGRKPRRGRKNSGNIDDDLDSIIAFVKHMHQTADGKQKLENMVINNIKNPAESDSTQLFLTEISETVSVPTPCASKNRRTLPRCQTA
ncbi:expressed unknown protein [Seminavis robusta]|uniref:Uncharacterized protein n=1 Tax=Seminavis robusta TaxID=568900 RepID=A0A9N8DHU7_9STRA|nr:expressed unknown protein [Seminavis robusta]|eukprot:Sro160_g072200.1 n/a (140) ;mRNA; f:58396-58815